MEFISIIKTPNIDKAILVQSDATTLEGTLCITTHYLLFSSRKNPDDEVWLLHSMVDAVEKKSFSSATTTTINQYKNSYSIPGGQIILKLKDFRQITIQINNNQEFQNAAHSIEYLSNLYDPRLLYPFFYRPNFKLLEDGWTIYTLEEEFREIQRISNDWRISNVNKDFLICPTYPEKVIVPKCIEDSVLISISKFRCLGRFPVLSYLHKKNKAAIMRSGQPMVGLNAKRCKEDEKLINSVLAKGKKGYVVETRTHNSATIARNKGGGYELEINYPLWRRVHRTTDRQGSLLESLSRFVDACNDRTSSMDKWLNKVESSGWLINVKDVLACACLIAQCIDKEGSSVLVHGAEGMDSTLQVCTLAQIILEPSMRTIRGFEWLIEKEWTNAGHPFYLRNNKSAFAFNSQQETKEQGPTFLLFLDCVHQIYKQFPNSFEFNEKFLITIFEHSYSSQYGTFLYNCIKQQKEYNFTTRTTSLWSYVNLPSNIENYINPTYEPNNRVIWPSVAPQSIVIWERLFYRWTLNQTISEPLHEIIRELKFKESRLKSEAESLRKQLLELVMNE